jgi:hypothetical protein
MREAKQGDSRCGYSRDVYATRTTKPALTMEEVRVLAYELARRRMAPLLNTSSQPSDDFDGCCE